MLKSTLLIRLTLQALIVTVGLKTTTGFQLSLHSAQSRTLKIHHFHAKATVHRQRVAETSLKASEQFETSSTRQESSILSLPDYLITDSIDLPDEKRPTLIEAVSNPREALSLTVMAIGTIISLFNVVGTYNDTYILLQSCAIFMGIFSSIAHLLQINTGYLISTNIRRGIVDDAAVNFYAALYSLAVSWLALRTSQMCPEVLTLKGVDVLLASLSIGVFMYSLIAPILTLLADSTHGRNRNENRLESSKSSNEGNGGNIPYQLSQSIVSFSRPGDNVQASSSDGIILPPLTDTELLRARGLLFIGLLGCVFTPETLSFAIGGQEWWGRVTTLHPSQKILESSTSLFALFATESSMIAHRVGKVGVAKYETIVPIFAGVCTVLAIVPCVCALHWLGDDITFFSLYKE